MLGVVCVVVRHEDSLHGGAVHGVPACDGGEGGSAHRQGLSVLRPAILTEVLFRILGLDLDRVKYTCECKLLSHHLDHLVFALDNLVIVLEDLAEVYIDDDVVELLDELFEAFKLPLLVKLVVGSVLGDIFADSLLVELNDLLQFQPLLIGEWRSLAKILEDTSLAEELE